MKKIIVVIMVLMSLVLLVLPAKGEATYELQPVEYLAEQKVGVLYLSSSALTELAEASYTEVNMLPSSVVHGYNKLILDGQEPVWIVNYYNLNGSTKYRVLLGNNGELIDYVAGDQKFSNTSEKKTDGYLSTERTDFLIYSDLYNVEGKHFFLWSHEERKAFSDKWRPIFQEYLGENPGVTDYVGTDIWLYTQRAYGVPNEQAVDEVDALEIAKAAIQNVDSEKSSCAMIATFYDVTDEEKPQWRIYIDFQYFVVLDAYSGEIVTVLYEPSDQNELIDMLICTF